jgi:hypothetical protein
MMTGEPRKLDPIEDALLELDAAERARVFERSSVEARQLLRQPGPVGWRGRAVRLVSAAAVIAIAVGIWGWVYSLQWSHLRERTGASVVAGLSADGAGGRFYECFQGPTGMLGSACRECDYDADGDVDLADFGAYQLAYVDMTH